MVRFENIREGFRRQKRLRDRVRDSRMKAKEDEILGFEEERLRTAKSRGAAKFKERQQAGGGSFKSTFGKFQDFATDFAKGQQNVSPRPKTMPIKKKGKRRRVRMSQQPSKSAFGFDF